MGGPAYAMTFIVEELDQPSTPSCPLPAPGDYISQHRLLGPRERKRKKKKKVKAKHSRNALPAGAGRWGGGGRRAGRAAAAPGRALGRPRPKHGRAAAQEDLLPPAGS